MNTFKKPSYINIGHIYQKQYLFTDKYIILLNALKDQILIKRVYIREINDIGTR